MRALLGSPPFDMTPVYSPNPKGDLTASNTQEGHIFYGAGHLENDRLNSAQLIQGRENTDSLPENLTDEVIGDEPSVLSRR